MNFHSAQYAVFLCVAFAAFWAARKGSAKTGAVNSVGKNPGPMALAVIPKRDQASAIARVSWTMAAFVAP